MNPPPANTFSIVARSELTLAQTDGMFQLLGQHFDGVTRTQFDCDLAGKNWAVLIWRGERLVGFSTLLVYETQFDAQPVSIVYSGDTIVAPEAWGTTALARGWIMAVNQLRERHPRGKYYWLLLTSGFRTYRFLPVFWKSFFPCHDMETPADMKRLRDQLAAERWGEQYDPHSGIVRFHHPQRLGEGLKVIPDGRTTDPHIAFFAAKNPGHAQGDELVCLTELGPENLTAAGRRMSAPQVCESPGDHR